MSWENYDAEREREEVLDIQEDEIRVLKARVRAWESNAEEAHREIEELIVNLPEQVLEMILPGCPATVFDWLEEAAGHLIAVDVERHPVRPDGMKYPTRAQAWDEVEMRREREAS